ncbi:hemagglutinin [Acidovorax cavernicola]|uniref:Hemagglutinin n=1 Tax=Acidovorax cavernicola TaxID=1675792 RepID=A0A9X8GWF4_9BURK|nr:hemagglutinin [Acidovorax cavernicola]RIX83594.1 hemagglutinin [Acidovorax cavernicola]
MTSPDVRKTYESAVAALGPAAERMLAEGASEEQVARWIFAKRDDLKLHYRALTPPDELEALEARSHSRYGNTLGPSIEQLRSAGKSWRDIIDSAARPGNHYHQGSPGD